MILPLSSHLSLSRPSLLLIGSRAIFLLLVASCSGYCLCSSVSHRPGERGPAPAAALFVFGDSILDAGNNNYVNTTTLDKANFWPYGITYFNFPTGRFSDGRLISDFIAEYANLPLIPPFLQPRLLNNYRFYEHGVNFASAGAGALVGTFHGLVIDLHTQLRFYKEIETRLRNRLGDVEARRRLRTSVYLFSIGINDYISLFLTNSTTRTTTSYSNKLQYVQLVLGNITSVIKGIYDGGGRKFGFINVPALGCLPALRILNPNKNDHHDCLEEASTYAILHNKALSRHLKKLRRNFPGLKYSYFDLYANLNRIINQPLKHGFKEGRTACCGTGKYRGVFSCGGKRVVKEFDLCRGVEHYVFWDSMHLTENAYKRLAYQMWTKHNDPFRSTTFYDIRDLFHSD